MRASLKPPSFMEMRSDWTGPESSRALGAHGISEASYSFFFYVRGREIYILILFVFFFPPAK